MNAGLSIQAWSNLDMFYSLIAHFVRSLLRQFFARSRPFVEIVLQVIYFKIAYISFIKGLLVYGLNCPLYVFRAYLYN
jgi:hypothetical protein